MILRLQILCTAVLALLASSDARAAFPFDWGLTGEISAEVRSFPREELFPEQESATASPSIHIELELLAEWNDGLDRVTFVPYARWDAHDDHRSHLDVRELHWIHQEESWSFLAGVGKVFWGVTESRHLVDIINQVDQVEDIDEEDKLGQPMLNVTLLGDWGAIDLFLLPYFRERTFPDEDARLRGLFKVSGDADYSSDLEEWHPDWALRWSQTLGEFDLGLSFFRGTSREPVFLPRFGSSPNDITLRPRYEVIDQIGFDGQWTHEAWLWKFEGIVRHGHADTFGAFVAGFEYTLFQIGGTDGDLGLLVEYLYDGRPRDPIEAPITRAEHDVFAGFRWAANNVSDTQLLGGAIVDTRSGETFAILEAAHRLGDSWLFQVEVRWLFEVERDSIAASVRRDSFVSARLTWHF
ncbi:MAG: hypothetical protein HKP27_12590 [Myxococcales bacterium]|nr:hypothetical protein [Myxococcales bacterium]